MANFSDHTVYIFSDVLRLIRDRGSTASNTNRAYLFGLWTSSFNPVVHGVLARWGNLKLESGPTAELDKAKAILKDNYQLCHIGEVSSPNERDRRQEQYGQRYTPGYLVLDVANQSVKALLYKSSISGEECRIEILQGENPFTGVRVRELNIRAPLAQPAAAFDYHGNRRMDQHRPGQSRWGTQHQQDRNTFLPTDEGRITTGQVARMGRVFETGGRDPETKYDQWYAISPGKERLRNMHDGIKDIASDGSVEMKRDAITHDMTFVFKYRGTEWEIAFPKDFPIGFLQLKEYTRVGDRRPITIAERNTLGILAEIENIVKKHQGSWW